MIETKTPPLQVIERESGKRVLDYAGEEKYAESFGYEWEHYSRTYSDQEIGGDLSRKRLELNLGFPLDFLKEKNVLEIGCGAGRFTEHLVKHAKQVIAIDLSRAVFCNSALGAPNLLAIRADLYELPEFSEPIDVVFCRGVIQHTPDPRRSLKRLFDYVRDDGLVIFDVYKKLPNDRWSFKYFWRPFFKRNIPLKSFDRYINRHARFLYTAHHFLLKIHSRIPVWRRLIAKTPLYLSANWETQYPKQTRKEREEVFKNEFVDMLYAEYDQPMTSQEVIDCLAEIGQVPYSYDLGRNHFRYKKRPDRTPLFVRFTKNGIAETPYVTS